MSGRPFLATVAALFLVASAGLAGLLAASTDDPGGGDFAWDQGEQVHAGMLQLEPYPVLRSGGRALMLSGIGKVGVQAEAAALAGQRVQATGIMIRRGELEMLQVGGLRAGGEAETLPPPVPLGRWRLTGEICDGKCYAGAMRPGGGLAHKACASLCLIGGIPAVFVGTGEVEGQRFFLLGGPDGGPLPDSLRDLVAVRIEIEAVLERVDDLIVVKADPATARVL